MFFNNIKDKLKKSRNYLHEKINNLLTGDKIIINEHLEELESILIQADFGIKMAEDIINELRKEKHIDTKEKLYSIVRKKFIDILKDDNFNQNLPLKHTKGTLTVVLVIGVNGSGKTTVIGRIAHKLLKEGNKVLLAAADTFRAAAVDQLLIWGKELGVEVIKHASGADPSAVVYDAISAAQSRKIDYLIIDTAGRFHTKIELIEELKKIDRTIDKRCSDGTKERLLVVDANCGQNALSQADIFNKAINLTGVVVTKLDGTAKGGILVRIKKELNVPIKMIGIGQEKEDLLEFDPEVYVESII